MNILGLIKKNIELPVFVLIFVVVTLLNRFGVFNDYALQVIQLACIYIIMAESLNILNGMTGLSSLGQAGFMSVGAYVSAMITTTFINVGAMAPALQVVMFILVTLVGATVSCVIGILIGMPAMRVRGDYLAIVTLGFCEVIRTIWRVVPSNIAGAAFGLTGIPKLANFFWCFLFMLLAVYACRNFMDSSYGRACIAIRDNEIAADTMGINCFKYKTIAFGTSAFIAGIAGSLYAHLLVYIHPDVFSYAKSSDFLVYLYAGGVGSISGAMLGATVLTILPEILRFLGNWRMVIYGMLLLFIILFRPTGMFGGREFAFLKLKTGGIKVFHANTPIEWFKNRKKDKEEAAAQAAEDIKQISEEVSE